MRSAAEADELAGVGGVTCTRVDTASNLDTASHELLHGNAAGAVTVGGSSNEELEMWWMLMIRGSRGGAEGGGGMCACAAKACSAGIAGRQRR